MYMYAITGFDTVTYVTSIQTMICEICDVCVCVMVYVRYVMPSTGKLKDVDK